MAEVSWLLAALDDLDEIAAYIQRDSDKYARIVVEKIRAATRDLAKYPLMGRVVPELSLEELRERIVYSYRIFYRVRGDRVTIIAVLHGARQVTDILVSRSSPPPPSP